MGGIPAPEAGTCTGSQARLKTSVCAHTTATVPVLCRLIEDADLAHGALPLPSHRASCHSSFVPHSWSHSPYYMQHGASGNGRGGAGMN